MDINNIETIISMPDSVLGQMARAVSYRDRITWVKLYKQYVRPHLDYCIQARSVTLARTG